MLKGVPVKDAIVVEPRVTPDGADIIFTSRIRFKLNPASKQLARDLLARQQMQVLSGDHALHQLVVWPLDEEMAVMQLVDRGRMMEYGLIKWVHESSVQSQAATLPLVNGFAEIVPRDGFAATDPRA